MFVFGEKVGGRDGEKNARACAQKKGRSSERASKLENEREHTHASVCVVCAHV